MVKVEIALLATVLLVVVQWHTRLRLIVAVIVCVVWVHLLHRLRHMTVHVSSLSRALGLHPVILLWQIRLLLVLPCGVYMTVWMKHSRTCRHWAVVPTLLRMFLPKAFLVCSSLRFGFILHSFLCFNW